MSKHFYQITDYYVHLKNPQKYKGTRPLSLRSGWEMKFVSKYLDINENVISWGSESVIVPYLLPTDGKMHRYYMDFDFIGRQPDGTLKEVWVEIKPYSQTIPPPKPKRVTKGTINAVQDWIKNSAKWAATELICEQARQQGRNLSFMKITEKDAPFFLT